MKLILFTILCVCIIPFPLEGAFLQYSTSARIAALSGISMLDGSASCLFLNPANIQNHYSLSTLYMIPFSLNDISYKNIALSYRFGKRDFKSLVSTNSTTPARKLTIALGYQDFGNDIYKEQSFVVGANCRIFPHYWLGASVRYLYDKTKGFDAQQAFQTDIGMRAEYKEFTFSTSYLNINFGELENDPLPQENRTFVAYSFAENLKAGFGFIKELYHPFSLRVGISYHPFKKAGFFSGFHTEPNQFTAGCEFSFLKCTIQYAIETHEYLKLTHYISIQYGK